MATNYPREAHPTDGWTCLPEEVALDLRITDLVAYRILSWALGRNTDFKHTLGSIAWHFRMTEARTRKALRQLQDLRYVTWESRHLKGHHGTVSDWTFHYPPLPGDYKVSLTVSGSLSQGVCFKESESGSLTQGVKVSPPESDRMISGGLKNEPHTKKEVTKNETLKNEVTKNEPKDLSPAQRSTEPTTPTVDAPRQSKSIAGRSSIVLLDDDDPEAVDDAPLPVANKTRKPRASGDLDFDRFWTAYGMRGTKRQAMDQWKKAIKRADVEDIIGAAERYAASTPDLQYRKYAERWLRDDCWTSLVVTPTNGHTNGYVTFKDAGPDVWAAAKAKLRNGSFFNSNG